eukprot:m.39970 g.39970  ORF g.39970 m.39970 type:complete len:111 (+) comp11676_c0_seq1:924-1256(+)
MCMLYTHALRLCVCVCASALLDTSPWRAIFLTNPLPDGQMGKLRVYKSGRMEMVFGDVRFEVSEGTRSTFAQEAVALDATAQHPAAICLGSVRRRYTVIPDIQQLLERNV